MLSYPSAWLLATLALAPAPQPAAPPVPPKDEACVHKVPEVPRRPRVDGDLKDLLGATTVLSRLASGHSPGLTARAAVFGDTLYLGIEVTDEHPDAASLVTLGLHAPDAGVAAPGHIFYIGPD